jgi:hypothetical protein
MCESVLQIDDMSIEFAPPHPLPTTIPPNKNERNVLFVFDRFSIALRSRATLPMRVRRKRSPSVVFLFWCVVLDGRWDMSLVFTRFESRIVGFRSGSLLRTTRFFVPPPTSSFISPKRGSSIRRHCRPSHPIATKKRGKQRLRCERTRHLFRPIVPKMHDTHRHTHRHTHTHTHTHVYSSVPFCD